MSNCYVSCYNIRSSIFTQSHTTSYSGGFKRIGLKYFGANFSVSYEWKHLKWTKPLPNYFFYLLLDTISQVCDKIVAV